MTEDDLHALVVGYTVALLRIRQGRTQGYLGKQVGLSKPTIARLERGRSRVNLYELQRIAVALQMRPEDLIERIRDGWARAEAGARAMFSCGEALWFEGVMRAAGPAGVQGLVKCAVACAVHPWP